VNLTGALRESCDVFFYEMAQRIGIDGIDGISAINDRLGLGQKFDLPLSGMSKGVNPSREWKQQKYKEEWLIGDTINASIGQGYTAATPMQLATMVARMASDRAVTPRFVRPADGTDIPASPLGVDATNLAMVHQGMFEVSNNERDTAYVSRIADPALAMAGKTGSSQVFSITAEERAAGVRSQAELPWNRRDHALFTAFAPFDKPRFALAVIVEHAGGGSTAAAPIARDIMLFAQHGKLPPEESYPQAQRARIREDLANLASRILSPDNEAVAPQKV
jgi:penicillin-binding protein 2